MEGNQVLTGTSAGASEGTTTSTNASSGTGAGLAPRQRAGIASIVSNSKTLLKKLINEEDIQTGFEFYQFIMNAMEFVLVEDNYDSFFKDLSTKQRKRQLKCLLLEGNRVLFKSNQEYKKHINDIFNEEKDIGNVSMLVLQFMYLVQEESRSGAHVSGARKAAFVKKAVKCFLRFTELSDEQQADIMLGLDTTIRAFILVKNNYLQHIDLKKLKNNCLPCL